MWQEEGNVPIDLELPAIEALEKHAHKRQFLQTLLNLQGMSLYATEAGHIDPTQHEAMGTLLDNTFYRFTILKWIESGESPIQENSISTMARSDEDILDSALIRSMNHFTEAMRVASTITNLTPEDRKTIFNALNPSYADEMELYIQDLENSQNPNKQTIIDQLKAERK